MKREWFNYNSKLNLGASKKKKSASEALRKKKRVPEAPKKRSIKHLSAKHRCHLIARA